MWKTLYVFELCLDIVYATIPVSLWEGVHGLKWDIDFLSLVMDEAVAQRCS